MTFALNVNGNSSILHHSLGPISLFSPTISSFVDLIVTVCVINTEVEAQIEWNQVVACGDEGAMAVWWLRLEIQPGHHGR